MPNVTIWSGGPKLSEVARLTVLFRKPSVYDHCDAQAPKPKNRADEENKETWKSSQR
jgi:hypothetical protein